jgi:drug/metabolite transporter (DMT)-like permease
MPRWLIYSFLALLFWGGWAVTPNALPWRADVFKVQALSTLGILPVLLVLGPAARMRSAKERRGSFFAFTGGLLGSGGNIAYYTALASSSNTSTIVPLTALYPLVTVVLAFVILRERPHRYQVVGIALSLISIYVLNLPGGGVDSRQVLAYALAAIALWGTAGLLQKVATNHVSVLKSSFWFHAAFVPVAAAIWIARPDTDWSLHAGDAGLVFLVGLFFALGNVTLLAAYGSGGKASIVTPLSGLYSLVAIPLAILFFDEKIGGRQWTGIALALAAVAGLSYTKDETQASCPTS